MSENQTLTASRGAAARWLRWLRRLVQRFSGRMAAPPTARSGDRGVESLELRVDRVRIHAAHRAGRRSDSAIVLIHGAGLDHRDWTFDFLHRMSRDWRVLAFDRPGFGASGRDRSPAAGLPGEQARLLRMAAEAAGVRRVVLVGHSWGGAVAMAWALDAPTMVAGVVSLAGAVAPWSFQSTWRNTQRFQAAALTAFGGAGLGQAALDGLNDSFAPNPIPPGYVAHMRTELSPFSGPTAAMMADIAAINAALAMMAPRYAGMERPVELVYGDSDRILSLAEQGEAAAKALPRARLTVLPGVGHMPHHVEPEICAAAIERIRVGA